MVERIRTSPAPVSWARRLVARSLKVYGGCTEWTGAVDRNGYGKFKVVIDGVRRQTGAHRAAWLALRGDIPGNLMPDHLCRNRACIDVNHMELVTNSENVLRGDHGGKKGHSGAPYASTRQHGCQAHGRSDGYIHTMRSGRARWVCRTCQGARMAAWRSRQTA